jgi:hypothetical protein
VAPGHRPPAQGTAMARSGSSIFLIFLIVSCDAMGMCVVNRNKLAMQRKVVL